MLFISSDGVGDSGADLEGGRAVANHPSAETNGDYFLAISVLCDVLKCSNLLDILKLLQNEMTTAW